MKSTVVLVLCFKNKLIQTHSTGHRFVLYFVVVVIVVVVVVVVVGGVVSSLFFPDQPKTTINRNKNSEI